MSLKQIQARVKVFFKEEPNMACRIKEVIRELVDEGFAEEKVRDLHMVFSAEYFNHTSPKEMLSLSSFDLGIPGFCSQTTQRRYFYVLWTTRGCHLFTQV